MNPKNIINVWHSNFILSYSVMQPMFKILFLLIIVFFGMSCGIPTLTGPIPREPTITIESLNSPFKLNISSNQKENDILNDPNLRILIGYRFFMIMDEFEAETQYRSIVNQLSNNFFGAVTIIQPNNNFGINLLQFEGNLITFSFSANEQLTFDIETIEPLLLIKKGSTNLTTITIPDSANFIGFFSFIRTYDQSTLQPIYSLVVGDELNRLITISE